MIEIGNSEKILHTIDFVSQTTAIGDQDKPKETEVYPNPGKGVFYIDTNNQSNENTQVQIYNAFGQLKQEISYPYNDSNSAI